MSQHSQVYQLDYQILNVTSFVIINSYGFLLMTLQKCFLFKKINRKNFCINVSDFQVINAKLGKKWKNPNEKPRGFPGGSVAKNPPAM